MNSFRLVLRNLLSSKTRFLLTLTGITLGITSLVILISLGSGLKSQIHKQATDLGANLIATPKGWCAYEQVKVLSGNQLPDAIPPEELAKIESIKDIKVIPYLTVGSAINNEPVPVTGIRVEDTARAKKWRLAKGELPGNDRYEILAGAAIAKSFKLSPGDTVTLRGKDFSVKGILEPDGTGDDGVLFIPLEKGQEVYATQGRVSFVAIQLKDISRVEYYAQLIADKANVSVVSDRQLLASVLSVVNTVNTTLRVIAAVAILTAAFGIINTMLMATFERRKEIGILKSIGSSNLHIFKIFMFESAFYGLLGGLVGLAAGALASQVITPYIAKNEFTAFISGLEVSALPPLADMAKILAGSILVAIIAGIYPASRAAKLTPVEAISYE